MSPETPPSRLEQISTHWPLIGDPLRFVLRYAPAIRRYLGAIVRNDHDADAVAQASVAGWPQKGPAPPQLTRGRFRDYLRSAVRNAALTHLRRKRPEQVAPALLESLAAPAAEDEAERQWRDGWRGSLLQR